MGICMRSGCENLHQSAGELPYDSRHFVPGYYHAVPPGRKPSTIETPRVYPSAYRVSTLGTVTKSDHADR
jgi:hypothetical protein